MFLCWMVGGGDSARARHAGGVVDRKLLRGQGVAGEASAHVQRAGLSLHACRIR